MAKYLTAWQVRCMDFTKFISIKNLLEGRSKIEGEQLQRSLALALCCQDDSLSTEEYPKLASCSHWY